MSELKKRQGEIDNERGWKICSDCEEKFNLDNFHFNNVTLTYCKLCKPCRYKYNKIYYQNNRGKCNEDSKRWAKDNRERRNKQVRINRSKPETKLKTQATRKRFRQNHPERIAKWDKEYRSQECVKMRRNQREAELKRANPEYALLCKLRIRLATLLRESEQEKTIKTMDLLGCDLDSFKLYIQSRFTEGMTWEKMGKGNGKICLDHILPCNLFDLADERQQKICFHYTNLQPLWGIDNTRKHDLLPNGQHASELNKEEKLQYLRELGYNL